MFSMHALCACQGIFDCWKSKSWRKDVKDLKLPFSAGLPYVPPTHTINLASFRDTHGGLTSLNLPLQVATRVPHRQFNWNPYSTKPNTAKSTTSSLPVKGTALTPAPSNASAAWCFTWLNPCSSLFILFDVCIASWIISQKAVLCDCTSENTARHMRCQDDDRLLHSFLPCSHSISTTQWCRKVLLPLKLWRMKVTLNLVKKLSWHCHTVTDTEEIWQNIM